MSSFPQHPRLGKLKNHNMRGFLTCFILVARSAPEMMKVRLILFKEPVNSHDETNKEKNILNLENDFIVKYIKIKTQIKAH